MLLALFVVLGQANLHLKHDIVVVAIYLLGELEGLLVGVECLEVLAIASQDLSRL